MDINLETISLFDFFCDHQTIKLLVEKRVNQLIEKKLMEDKNYTILSKKTIVSLINEFNFVMVGRLTKYCEKYTKKGWMHYSPKDYKYGDLRNFMKERLMVTKFRKPLTTLLNKANKPLSDKERVQSGKEWAERTLDSLLAYIKTEPSFTKKFCKKVESDDELARVMLSHLRSARKGKSKRPESRSSTMV